jgi:hypothetical protein
MQVEKPGRIEWFTIPPPRITLRWLSTDSVLAWSRNHIDFGPAERAESAMSTNAFALLKAWLEQLWIETRPGGPLPPPFALQPK